MRFQVRLVFTTYYEFNGDFVELAASIFVATVFIWAIYLPLAWLGRERFFFDLMRKEDKCRQYWLKFFPAFLKRELKAAFLFFVLLMIIGFIEYFVGKGQ
jgi:hypothetical protein